MDRRRSDPLRERPNVKMHYGWNGWSHAAAAPVVLLPAGDAGGAGGGDWWSGELLVAPDASELNFVFSDGDGVWDNAHGRDYSVPVADAAADAAAIAPRRIASQETHALAGGTLHIIKLALRDGLAPGAEARAARWQEEKVLRVWTPPGWDRATAQDLPVLYMVESQNLFEDWLAHQGVSWRAAETAAGLLESGALPPFLIVGIDAVGHFRSLNYLPFAPGTGVGDFRHECARWPGGNVDAFLRRVRTDVLPLAEREFGASTRRERRAFGGASFGGVAALHAALTCADIFGGVLAESPSLWAGEGRYLDTLRSHHGALPDRLFLGSGTREYSATRDHEHHDHDARLAHYVRPCCCLRRHRTRTVLTPAHAHHACAASRSRGHPGAPAGHARRAPQVCVRRGRGAPRRRMGLAPGWRARAPVPRPLMRTRARCRDCISIRVCSVQRSVHARP